MKNRCYLDVHVLQTVPPSCVNRDDTGSPKTAIYGGTTRARVSSQAWKHAMREMFREELIEPDMLGARTKNVISMVAEEILKLNPDAKAAELAEKVLTSAGVKFKDDKKGETKDKKAEALFFMSAAQAKALAEIAVSEGTADKDACKKALKNNPSVDIALFGRMVASEATLNCDASAQVAHSISTHTVQNEYDYFKQNTFANRTLPSMVYVTIRRDQPVNLCGAFEKPVSAKNGGYSEESEEKFVEYANKVYDKYASAPDRAFAVGEAVGELAECMSLDRLLESVAECVKEYLGESEGM